MISFLFFAKLFVAVLFVLCTFRKTAGSENAAKTVSTIEIFKNEENIQNIMPPEGGDANGNIEIESFYSLVLLSTDDVIIAVIGGKQNGNFKKNIDILTRYAVKKKDDVWIKNAFKTGQFEASWKTQFLLQKTDQKEKSVKSLAAVAQENKMYVFLVNHGDKLPSLSEGGDKKWELALIESDITKDQQQTFQKIAWRKKEPLILLTNDQFKESEAENYPQFFSSFVTTDKKVAFVVKSTKVVGGDKNTFFILLLDVSKTEVRVLRVGDVKKDCIPYFFWWGNKIIMISSNCGEINERKIKGFDVAEDKLNEDNKFSGRVWDFLKDKKDITTATTTTNKTPVVLFTQEKANGSEASKKDIHLWVTDGNRSAKVGIVFNKVKDGFQRSFLCTEKGLFALHQKDDESSGKIYNITHFEGPMGDITFVLNLWKQSKEKFIELCQKMYTAESVCSTDGLVGFLFEKGDANKWKDGYYFSNATVAGGTEFENGFTFNKQGEGAKWSVGKALEEDQPYNFAEPGFTLAATVVIDSVASGTHNSILGVKLTTTEKKLDCCAQKMQRGV